MNVYVVTINISYGLFIGVVIAENETNAINLVSDKLILDCYIFNMAEIRRSKPKVNRLPVTPEKNVEEVLYINGYEE